MIHCPFCTKRLMASLFHKAVSSGTGSEDSSGLEINCFEGIGTTEVLSNPTEKGKKRTLLELK